MASFIAVASCTTARGFPVSDKISVIPRPDLCRVISNERVESPFNWTARVSLHIDRLAVHRAPILARQERSQSIFDYAYECAQEGRLWTEFRRTSDSGTVRSMPETQNVPCPADDALIGAIASR